MNPLREVHVKVVTAVAIVFSGVQLCTLVQVRVVVHKVFLPLALSSVLQYPSQDLSS